MMKKFLTFLISGAFLLIYSNAFALPINTYWDLSGATGEGLSGTTDVFSAVSYVADTTSYVSESGAIVDYGLALGDGLTGAANELGLNVTDGYEFTMAWTNLVGQIIEPIDGTGLETQFSEYYSGTIEMYIEDVSGDPIALTPTSATDSSFAGAEGNTLSDFTGGANVATVEIVGGYNTLSYNDGSLIGGFYTLVGKFTALNDNFWYEETNEDLYEKYFVIDMLFGDTTGSNSFNEVKEVLVNGSYDYTDEDGNSATIDYVKKIHARHDADFKINPVPEPTTMVLFGIGLLSLASVTRRKA